MNFIDLNQYDYALPPELIRKQGVEPRDSARLFVYDTRTDTVILDIFRNIADYLPEQSFLVLNDTRVLPVRLWLSKETGGKIEVFVLMNKWDEGRDNDYASQTEIALRLQVSKKLSFLYVWKARQIFRLETFSIVLVKHRFRTILKEIRLFPRRCYVSVIRRYSLNREHQLQLPLPGFISLMRYSRLLQRRKLCLEQ